MSRAGDRSTIREGDGPVSAGRAFDEGALVAEARQRAGLGDFGDEFFREPLRVLLTSLRDEAGLNAVGIASQRARLVDSLVTRLMAEEQRRRHPEIEDERLDPPVVIVGLARTGTTLLHRLLASGGDWRTARWWEVRYPAPFPGSDWRRDDPRIPAAHEEIRLTLEAVPQLAAIHPWDAEGADEEIMLLEHSFMSHVPESGADLPGYRAWLDRQDLRPAYRDLARWLRLLQWQKKQAGRDLGARWLLKAPFHLGYLDALFEVFPGARLVLTHRDPLETIPSAASMYSALWALARDEVDETRVGAQVQRRYAWALGRCMEARTRYPGERFLDVDYRAVQRAPMAEVRRIYRWLGVPLSDPARRAMEGWLADDARHEREAHRYSLAQFGFDPEELAAVFADYRRLHVLPA
ncbi:MAG: sulfotransferase family protein [Myxococcota bacterium]